MCRVLFKATKDPDELKPFGEALKTMRRGGPDGTKIDIKTYQDWFLLMGHNRLSILDLSSKADQPMTIGDTSVLFNGEIYNFKELKIKYGIPTDSTGDTEVILRLYQKIGTRIFGELDGEYAIVIFDRTNGEIIAGRDPLGIKPLYLFNPKGSLILSSEIKGILPFLDKTLNIRALKKLYRDGFTGDETLYGGVFKIRPGSYYVFDLEKNLMRKEVQYWSISVPDVMEPRNTLLIKDSLELAVKKRMISDVPISCTLSGGLDSSLIAYLMSQNSKLPINTYTIGFKGFENEFLKAKRVAEFIGSNHREIEMELDDLIARTDEIIDAMEEPMDKGSVLPTFALALAIREKVTLIGEGADELFGGYSRHQENWHNPEPRFLDYYRKHLKVFQAVDDPDEFYEYYKDPSGILVFDLKEEIPNFHNMRIDKLFMNSGIEARVPFLDPSLVKIAMGIPHTLKMDPEKKCLRDAFREFIPSDILDAPKKALKIPYDEIVDRPQVKEVILSDEELFGREWIEELYAAPRETRNRGRMLWMIYLAVKWYGKNFKNK